ncbi:protein-disulfide reductase DsbD family protein [Pseudidiomarina sp.]|uniref:protein-disulfide reductase DsbD family protein n=1 Tax=Pseudidiomarina sp. TaxID=2081707 RepID=UPI003A97FB11
MKPHLVIWQLVTLLLLLSSSAQAQVATDWQQLESHQPVQVRLVVPGKIDAEALTVDALLQVKLADDWKTYWRTPGEGGVPPQLAWQAESENIAAVNWRFPVPERFSVQGVETVGYQGDVSFPLQIEVQDWQQRVSLQGTLTLASCTNICVISDYPIALEFTPSDLRTDMDAMFLLEQAQSRLPHRDHPLLRVEQLIWSASQQQLSVTVENADGWQQPRIFVDSLQQELTDLTIEQVYQQQDGNRLTAHFAISHWLEQPNLVGETLQVTIADELVRGEQRAVATAGTIPHSAATSSVWYMLPFALLGGLILNIMPCVLPVLGLKMQGLIGADRARGQIRRQFVASALGIITSFVLLALMIMALKLGGHAIGWGIQFQNPYFIGGMALVIGLFALSVSGLWTLQLPHGMQQWVAARGNQSTTGHFVQGMFATLLATPCTAPFLGTAVAFALAASNVKLLLIFITLGVGMALPWLVVAVWPGLAQKLPKPGPWLQWVNRVFAALLLLTTAWLVSLLANHLSRAVFVAVLVGFIAFAFWLAYRRHGGKGVLVSLATVLLLSGVALVASSWTSSPTKLEQHPWQPLKPSAISSAVAQGQVVFVDVTADWCVTCQANKIGVLLQDPVASALRADNVVLMQGDWTRPNQAITDYLHSYGRYGVPFNQVYGPGAPQGIPLPVILTDNAVLSAIEQARE